MSIPGHAPRPKTPPDPDQHLLAPHHRDAGLDRVGQVTRWTVVGGLVLTGGFAVVAAGTQPGHTRTTVQASTATVTVPGPTGDPTTAPSTTATTSPTTTTASTAAADPGANTAETTPPTTAAPLTAPPLTAPPLTAPPQPAYTPPATTPAPPVVTSGAS